MSNKVKVPGGAFYAGDGLTVDPITRTVSAGGGDVTTPDWNQNDETASDYIKNRPGGYDDYVLTQVIKTIVFNQHQSGNIYQGGCPSDFSNLLRTTYDSGHHTIEVKFNDISYDNVPIHKDVDEMVGTFYYIGDVALTDYPFCIGWVTYVGGGSYDTVCYYSEQTSIETWLTGYQPQPVKINNKYLDVVIPNNIGYRNISYNSEWSYGFTFGSNNQTYSLGSWAIGGQNKIYGSGGAAVGKWLVNTSNINNNAVMVGQWSETPINDTDVPDKKLILCSGKSNVKKDCFGANESIGKFYIPIIMTELQLKSTTEGSTKRYKVTVDDTGALTATEVTT